jgi:cytochrome c biogenesis protein
MAKRERLSAFLRAVSSMEAGLALFALVAAAAVVGSLSPALSGAVYGSWPFAALLALLAANTLACVAMRRPGLARSRASRGGPRLRALSVFAIHLSVLVIAAAGAWANLEFTTERVEVAEGESFVVEGRSLRLESIEIERNPDGSVSDWSSSVSRGDGGAEKSAIRVNHPLRVGASRVLQSGYGRRYSILLSAPGENAGKKVELDEGAMLPLSADSSLGLVLRRGPEGDGAREVGLSVVSGGKELPAASLRAGVPIALGDTGVELSLTGSRAYGTFIVRRTPGIGLVWTGFALLALSSAGLLLRSGREEPGRLGSGGEA